MSSDETQMLNNSGDVLSSCTK